MHTKNVKTLSPEKTIQDIKEETLRIIEIEIDLLKKMKETPDLITEKKEESTQTFDKETLEESIGILSNEKEKIKNLELVLAITGTLKAGKSTTINAIVGTEILPNRNTPMTALPTLIRHVKGQRKPVLKFEKNKPILDLMEKLKQQIKEDKNQKRVKDLKEGDKDIKELLEFVSSDKELEKRYEGAKDIFIFLKQLNDLARLFQKFGIEFPFSDYNEINNLPVIEVEFEHLRKNGQTEGKFALLDMPGPNEGGKIKIHLKKMFKEQLSKASAVMVVLDYTHFKSNAYEEFVKDLEKKASVLKDRIYALVNKFDSKDRNSSDEKDTKKLAAESLKLPMCKIFPVSAKFAYLANRARHELSINGKLPDYKKHSWVEDFGEAAFGCDWEEDEKISNNDEIKKRAEKLWKKSLFEKPLKDIIEAAHTRAPVLAVDSATKKLLDMAKKMEVFLSTRENALETDVEKLEKQIGKLKQDIEKVDKVERDTEEMIEKQFTDFKDKMKHLSEEKKEAVSKEFDKYFKEGKKIEKKLWEERKNRELVPSDRQLTLIKNKISNFISGEKNKKSEKNNNEHIEEEAKKDDNEQDFDPNSPVIKFDRYERDKAEEFLKNINKSLDNLFSGINKEIQEIQKDGENLQKDFTDKIKEITEESNKIIEEMKGHLKECDLDLDLKPPAISEFPLEFSINEMLEEIFSDLIAKKEKTVTKWRRKSGLWGWICELFDTDDWGWEKYETTEEYFEIDIKHIENKAFGFLEAIFSTLENFVKNYAEGPIESSINDFFSKFREIVEKIKGDIQQGIEDHKLDKAKRENLKSALKDFIKKVSDIIKDVEGVKQDILEINKN